VFITNRECSEAATHLQAPLSEPHTDESWTHNDVMIPITPNSIQVSLLPIPVHLRVLRGSSVKWVFELPFQVWLHVMLLHVAIKPVRDPAEEIAELRRIATHNNCLACASL
jgi:hypothetical protein